VSISFLKFSARRSVHDLQLSVGGKPTAFYIIGDANLPILAMSRNLYRSIPSLTRELKDKLALRILLAIGFVALALALTQLLWLVVERPVSSPLFFMAIIFYAWVCGFRCGVLAAFLSGITIDYYFIQPIFEFTGARDEVVRLLIFFFEGVFLSWLIEKLRIVGDEVNTKNLELRALSDRQQQLREEEQKRIAREVHDELGQALTGIKMYIHLLRKQVDAAEVGPHVLSDGLGGLIEMTDDTIHTVRRIASELRPSLLDDFGLIPAMEWQVHEFSRRTSIACDYETNTEKADLGAERNNAVYRIVQEALTNVARHANANRVSVEISSHEDAFSVLIADNGRGISLLPNQPLSLGLIGMEERSRMIGGELEIESTPSVGTRVRLSVPLNGHAKEKDSRRNSN